MEAYFCRIPIPNRKMQAMKGPLDNLVHHLLRCFLIILIILIVLNIISPSGKMVFAIFGFISK